MNNLTEIETEWVIRLAKNPEQMAAVKKAILGELKPVVDYAASIASEVSSNLLDADIGANLRAYSMSVKWINKAFHALEALPKVEKKEQVNPAR